MKYYKFLPKVLRWKIYHQILNEINKNKKINDKKIPYTELENKNINNLKVVINRESLLEMMPKQSVVAEIGVEKGEFSQKILSITNPKKLHLAAFSGKTSGN